MDHSPKFSPKNISQNITDDTNPSILNAHSNEIIIVSGISGAGMSTALQVLEDLNFFTADGLPPSLITEFSSLIKNADMQHFRGLALGIDMRKKNKDTLLNEVIPALEDFKHRGYTTSILFLEANADSLLQRYATTRRPHPLESEGLTLENAILEECLRLQCVRNHADIILNTSNFSLHDLRRAIQRDFYNTQETLHSIRINLMSFGFKYGVPKEADMVFDVRFLPNPHFNEDLRPLSGLDKEIIDYIFQKKEAQDFQIKFLEFLRFLLPQYNNEGRYRLCIAIGCTGGRHRSVATTEYIGKHLTNDGYTVIMEHRHLNMD